MLDKWLEESVETAKYLLSSALWAIITIMAPLAISIHLNIVYGLEDSVMIFCICYWWYMVVSGSDRVNGWLEAKLNLNKERRIL